MSRRLILLLVAILVALLGTLAVFLYVRNLENEAESGQEQVQVLVATQAIPFGQTGAQAQEAGSLELTTLPAEAVVEGALSSVEPIADLSALSPIFPGEQILQQNFGTPGATSPLPIPEGKLAVSIQLSDPARVAGFVGPGSQVAIFLTATPPDGGELFTTVMLPRVDVIAAGQTTVVSRTITDPQGQQTTEEIPLAILTLAVTQTEAQSIVQAQTQGALYFGLLTDTSQTTTGEITTFGNVVPIQ
jgi:pilus assembly protein CpaB